MANDPDFYVDVPRAREISTGFGSMADVLRIVSAALEAAMTTLKATAFIGLVGGTALERYLANIKPHVDRLAAKCEEMSNDVNSAADAFEQAGQSG